MILGGLPLLPPTDIVLGDRRLIRSLFNLVSYYNVTGHPGLSAPWNFLNVCMEYHPEGVAATLEVEDWRVLLSSFNDSDFEDLPIPFVVDLLKGLLQVALCRDLANHEEKLAVQQLLEMRGLLTMLERVTDAELAKVVSLAVRLAGVCSDLDPWRELLDMLQQRVAGRLEPQSADNRVIIQNYMELRRLCNRPGSVPPDAEPGPTDL